MWRIIGAGIALAHTALILTNLRTITIKTIVTLAIFRTRIIPSLHTQGQPIIAGITGLKAWVAKALAIPQITNHAALSKRRLTIPSQCTLAILCHLAGPDADTLLTHLHRITVRIKRARVLGTKATLAGPGTPTIRVVIAGQGAALPIETNFGQGTIAVHIAGVIFRDPLAA